MIYLKLAPTKSIITHEHYRKYQQRVHRHVNIHSELWFSTHSH